MENNKTLFEKQHLENQNQHFKNENVLKYGIPHFKNHSRATIELLN